MSAANEQLDTIPEETMRSLIRHPGPGNIRELQNYVAQQWQQVWNDYNRFSKELEKPMIPLISAESIRMERATGQTVPPDDPQEPRCCSGTRAATQMVAPFASPFLRQDLDVSVKPPPGIADQVSR